MTGRAETLVGALDTLECWLVSPAELRDARACVVACFDVLNARIAELEEIEADWEYVGEDVRDLLSRICLPSDPEVGNVIRSIDRVWEAGRERAAAWGKP